MVTGPYRIPIVQFSKSKRRSPSHAQQAGELLTGSEGHPSQLIVLSRKCTSTRSDLVLQESMSMKLPLLICTSKLLDVKKMLRMHLEERART